MTNAPPSQGRIFSPRDRSRPRPRGRTLREREKKKTCLTLTQWGTSLGDQEQVPLIRDRSTGDAYCFRCRNQVYYIPTYTIPNAPVELGGSASRRHITLPLSSLSRPTRSRTRGSKIPKNFILASQLRKGSPQKQKRVKVQKKKNQDSGNGNSKDKVAPSRPRQGWSYSRPHDGGG